VTQGWPTGKTALSKPIVELLSPTSGDGKTELLCHLCAKAVLPKYAGGQQAAVVVIDTDGQFSVERLARHLRTFLENGNRDATRGEESLIIDDEILSALKHVHIFRPQSLLATAATLDSLPTYLFDQHTHHSYDREVAFIAIDSASAFYWQEQARTENARFQAATGESSNGSLHTDSCYETLFASLEAAKVLDCPAIVTTCYFQPIYADNKTPRAYRQLLPDFRPTLRVVVQRLAVRKFPPGISVEQALRESADRQKAVDAGNFECFVNQYGMEERKIKAMAGQDGFGFVVDESGVIVDKVNDDEFEQSVRA
jgi:hypothetical protein